MHAEFPRGIVCVGSLFFASFESVTDYSSAQLHRGSRNFSSQEDYWNIPGSDSCSFAYSTS